MGIGSHIITPYYDDQPIRVIKLQLNSGEIETLITNLFDLDEADFKELYFKRWPVETKYDIVKNKLELPNFTDFTESVIYQDFWISMYMVNIAAVAKYESDILVHEERAHKNNKYQYQTNVNNLIGTLRGKFANAVFFATEEERNKIIQDLMQHIRVGFHHIKSRLIPHPFFHMEPSLMAFYIVCGYYGMYQCDYINFLFLHLSMFIVIQVFSIQTELKTTAQ